MDVEGIKLCIRGNMVHQVEGIRMEGYTSALLGSRFKRQERKRREAGREGRELSLSYFLMPCEDNATMLIPFVQKRFNT